MSYASFFTKHSMGDVVYFHDSESDTVQRGVVIGIEAKATSDNQWAVLYTVAHKFASDPPAQPSLIAEADLHDTSRSAWPAIPPEPTPLVADEVPA